MINLLQHYTVNMANANMTRITVNVHSAHIPHFCTYCTVCMEQGWEFALWFLVRITFFERANE